MGSLKVLIVGHAYVTEFGAAKYVSIKRQETDLSLRLVVPSVIGHSFQQYRAQRPEGLTDEEYIVLPSYFSSNHMVYLHHPIVFAKILREFRPDVIHIDNDAYSAVGLQAFLFSKLFCPRAKIMFFLWDNLNRHPKFPAGFIKQTLNRVILGNADYVICGNRRGQELLKVKGYVGPSSILPQLGLDERDYEGTHRATMRESLGLQDDELAVGFIGRLTEDKGLPELLEAVAAIPDPKLRCVLIGGGPMEAALRGTWRTRLGDRLILRPVIPHREVAAHMSALDLFVLPSRTTPTWVEQFGVALAQAMLAGLPSIGSSSGAIPDVLQNAGIVFPERDSGYLRKVIATLASDPQERELIGRKCAAVARANYTNSSLARSYVKIYRALGRV